VAEAFVFAEEPRGERDKRAVRREDPNEDGIGKVTSRGIAVNLVDVSVSSGTGGERRRARDGEGDGRGSPGSIDWRGLGGEVRKGVKGSGGGDWGRGQRSKSLARQDDDDVLVGNEVVGEVQRRS
jgi:hypothetical protein